MTKLIRREAKSCLRCGAEFGCGAAEGAPACWCQELPPVMPVSDAAPYGNGRGAAEPASLFRGASCLCPKCLKAEIEGLIAQAGLCASCRSARRLSSKGGSIIYFCRLSADNPRFPKYPPLPISSCPGYEKPGS